MTQGLAVRNIDPETYSTVEPQLVLLLERKPGYQIFFRNFLDLILRRSEPPLFLASRPVHFRKHFYVRTGVPWLVILESIVWHAAAVPLLLVLWTWSLSWEIRHYAVPRSHTVLSQQEIYYPQPQAFPAREGRQHEEAPSERSEPQERALRVAKEQRRENVKAPEVAVKDSPDDGLTSSDPTLPAVPFSATARPKLVLPGDLVDVIGPAPDGGQLAMRAVSGLAASPVVAPAPKISRAGRGAMLSAPVSIVAPAPALQGSLGPRKMGGEIGSVGAVSPTPSLPLSEQLAGRGARNGAIASSGVAVVPPAPSVRGRVYRPGGSGDLIGGTGTQAVAPSPSLGHALVLAGGHGNSLAGSGEQIVPPAPSIRGRAYLAGNGGKTIGGVGTNVVAPSPSLRDALTHSRGRGNSLSDGSGTDVARPAPTLAGSGGRGGDSGSIRSFGDGNGSVIAPAPAAGMMPTHGGPGGSGTGLLNGAGERVIAPTPSLGGTGFGNSGAGFGSGGKSLAASLGTETVAPPGIGGGRSGTGMGSGNGPGGKGSMGSAGSGQGGSARSGSGAGSAGGGTEIAGLGTSSLASSGGSGASGASPIISSAIPAPTTVPDIPAGKTETVPLRVIQLALALPTSSFFSNYEAFVAERSVNRDTTQLIKLVYIFLPYQRRLTEFGVKPAKTFNLRVTRDPSCDESLLSMTWPEGERGQPPAEQAKDKLPCYRTTADDYRKAWEKVR